MSYTDSPGGGAHVRPNVRTLRTLSEHVPSLSSASDNPPLLANCPPPLYSCPADMARWSIPARSATIAPPCSLVPRKPRLPTTVYRLVTSQPARVTRRRRFGPASKGLGDVPCPEARSHFIRGVVVEELEGGRQEQEPVVRCNTDCLGRAVGVDAVPHVAPRELLPDVPDQRPDPVGYLPNCRSP
jgi:hypothetical protein